MSTGIEWTDETWNPVVGCDKVSPGCDNCYAIGVAHRAMQPAHVGLTVKRAGERPDWSGVVRCLPARLDVPLRWRKPRRVFVNSMSDLFHPDVPETFVGSVWNTMALAPAHTFQILTKRPQLMARTLQAWEQAGWLWRRHDLLWCGPIAGPLSNVWLGTSIESDRYAFRADHMRATPAAVRFLSLEPLLGPLPSLDLTGIDWVIVGGESGPGARPMHPDWVSDIRDRCQKTGTAFFFKQWGAWGPLAPLDSEGRYDTTKRFALANDGTLYGPGDLNYPDGPRRGETIRANHGRAHLTAMYRLGKHGAGRELDGRTWDEMPRGAA